MGEFGTAFLREKSASFGLENKVVLHSEHDNVHVYTYVNEQGNIKCLLNPIQELWYLVSSLYWRLALWCSYASEHKTNFMWKNTTHYGN